LGLFFYSSILSLGPPKLESAVTAGLSG